METKRYYTMENYFVNRMRRFGRQMSNRSETVEEHIAWKNELRARLREAIGLNRMQTCDLKPEVLEETACDGYTRRKIVIQTEPEVYMPFFMLVPDDIKPGKQSLRLPGAPSLRRLRRWSGNPAATTACSLYAKASLCSARMRAASASAVSAASRTAENARPLWTASGA